MAEHVAPGPSDFALRPMHWRQLRAIALVIALSGLDGFDILAITFAAPGIAAEWGLRATALGAVISAGLLGMGAGSILLGPIADRIGRRPTVFLCLALMLAGTLLTSAAHNVPTLAAWRLLTGLGIGGMLPVLNALASEHSNEASRVLSISLMAIGYPSGGLLGGLVAAQLIQHYDWRAIFLLGSALAGVMAIAVYFFVSETIQFLNATQPPNALARVNRVLERFGHPTISTFPPKPVKSASSFRRVFARPYLNGTLTILLGFFFQSLCFYFIQGWLTKLLTERGFSIAEAINTSALFNMGGIMGGIALGWLSSRCGLRGLLLCMTAGFTVSMQAYSLPLSDLGVIRLVAVVMGVTGSSAIVAFYAILARYYPADLRATGSGLVLGFGRSAAAIGPLLGGALLDAGLRSGDVVKMVSLFAILAGLLLVRLPLSPAQIEAR